MNKSAIISISRSKYGYFWVEYTRCGNHVNYMQFIGYNKREALAVMREILEIKRNPIKIRDYDKQPRRPLAQLLQELALYQ